MDYAATIARIYNHGIEDGIATFRNEPRSVADIEQMLGQRGDTFPTVVVERDRQIVAWAGPAPTVIRRGMRRSSSTPSMSSARTAVPESGVSRCWRLSTRPSGAAFSSW
jgi:hypothetical protein